MVYPAHITTIQGKEITQSVEVHCINTAQYASQALEHIGLKNTAYLAGILHDFGKFTAKFKQYLEDAHAGKAVKRGSVNHTFAAVIYLLETYGKKDNSTYERMLCEIIAYGTGAHHGLFDGVNLQGESGFCYRTGKDRREICYEEAKKNYFEYCISEEELQILFGKSVLEVASWMERIKQYFKPQNSDEHLEANDNLHFQIGLLSRLLLSAVIHGDRRDTGEFFAGKKQTVLCADKALWGRQLNFLMGKMSSFPTDTPINQARHQIAEACGEFVTDIGGLYKITVPTGAGKTLSMLRFALTQAERHNKKRILFIIPLLSVLDQNSKVMREYIESEDLLLEHHSNVIHTDESTDELDRYELLCDTWDSPIIITTLVQLLNVLFASKTTAIRRMQSLCDSVIVIDEVQSVPKKLTYMFNMAVNFLVSSARATVVLSSATQPAFDLVKRKMHMNAHSEILPYSRQLWQVFERTQIRVNRNKVFENEEELADYTIDFFEDKTSLLIICNTKRSAASVYEYINKATEAEVYHLSTAMCMAHRKKVLKNVTDSLDAGRRLICVSTQLVEAGVDFSFESVIRVEAGLDNIAQAAGRCNRNGRSKEKGIVEVVRLQSEKLTMLREIATAQGCFRRFMADFEKEEFKYGDILSPESVRRYSELLYHELETSLSYPLKCGIQNRTMYDLLGSNHGSGTRGRNYCINQAFATAGSSFRVFDEDTFDVIVPYDEGAEQLIENIKVCAPYDFETLKGLVADAKPYMVHIYSYQLESLTQKGMITFGKSNRIRILEKPAYDSEKGLDEELKGLNYYL